MEVHRILAEPILVSACLSGFHRVTLFVGAGSVYV